MVDKRGDTTVQPIQNFNRQGTFMGAGPPSTIIQEEGGKPNFSELLQMPGMKINLFCSIMIWLHGSFNFFLITFYLKYFPGNIYVNAMCFACADLLAYLNTGIILKFFQIRQGLFISYGFSLTAGVLYLVYQDSD